MRKIYFSFILVFIYVAPLLSQEKVKIIDGKNYNNEIIKKFSISNNAYNFMAMGYYIDANNTLYLATKDKKYLDENLMIIKNVLNTYLPTSKNYKPWTMNVSKKNQNHVVNGKEHLISEGYFFRYLGEFIFILKENNLYLKDQKELMKGLKYSFDKWNKRSLDKYKDQSLLYHVRFNIGANWSVVALYIDHFFVNNNKVYNLFYTEFNKQLKMSIKNNSEIVNNKVCYIWNSTYPTKFTNQLKKLKEYPIVFEDVSHANHTVNFILTTIKLKKDFWNTKDLESISNSIIQIVWDPAKIIFTDNLNGTINKNLNNTGWKQSDGFMKLMLFDKELYPIYKKYYTNNFQKIINSSLGLQFQANFILYDSTYY